MTRLQYKAYNGRTITVGTGLARFADETPIEQNLPLTRMPRCSFDTRSEASMLDASLFLGGEIDSPRSIFPNESNCLAEPVPHHIKK